MRDTARGHRPVLRTAGRLERTTMKEPLLRLENLACGYHQQTVVKGLKLELAAGEIACLLGPSGCGKTTTLRAIAGLEPVTAGSISIQGKQVSGPHRQLPPNQRGLGIRPATAKPGGTRRAGTREPAAGTAQRPGATLPPRTLRRPTTARGAGPGTGTPARPAIAG